MYIRYIFVFPWTGNLVYFRIVLCFLKAVHQSLFGILLQLVCMNQKERESCHSLVVQPRMKVNFGLMLKNGFIITIQNEEYYGWIQNSFHQF